MDEDARCPIWGTPAEGTYNAMIKNKAFTCVSSSPRAGGVYCIDARWENILRDVNEQIRARLTTWLIEQRLQGTEWPEITEDIIEQIKQRQPLPVHERADRLLRYIARQSRFIGSHVCFMYDDNNQINQEMLAWSESTAASELNTFEEFLAKQGWIEIDEEAKRQRGFHELMLTVEGYTRLAELDAKNKDSLQGFVAMWFPDKNNKDYDCIKKAYDEGIDLGIRQAGYDPLKINDLPHNDQITDKIISEIRRSKFLVADFTHGDTGVRGGVYYEAGFARGYNIPVIYTCCEEIFLKPGAIHFDIQQQNFIRWTSPEDLREKVKNRITGSEIGWGPNKPPAAE